VFDDKECAGIHHPADPANPFQPSCLQETFSLIKDFDIAHIALAQEADILVIAPATANIIGKIAAGLADDLLTTVVMATKATGAHLSFHEHKYV